MSKEEKESQSSTVDKKIDNFYLRATTQWGGKTKGLNSTLLGFKPTNIVENEGDAETSKNADLYQSYGKRK